jgi:hypothetical protein
VLDALVKNVNGGRQSLGGDSLHQPDDHQCRLCPGDLYESFPEFNAVNAAIVP